MASEDRYYVDDAPRVNDGPAATGSEPKSVKGTMTKQVGPLPVWGWGVVAIAAVFLWKRISGSSSSASGMTTADYVPPSPSQSMGGVFLLPSNGAPGGTTGGATVPADVAIRELSQSYDPALDPDPKPTPSQLKDFYAHTFQAVPESDRGGLAAFFAQNAAAKNLGLPYLTGKFDSSGRPQQFDPKTGAITYVPIPPKG